MTKCKLNTKIRVEYMSDFTDNYDGTILNDERRQVELEKRPQVLDANSIEDKDFDSIVLSDVVDRYGQVIGKKSVIKRKQKRKGMKI